MFINIKKYILIYKYKIWNMKSKLNINFSLLYFRNSLLQVTSQLPTSGQNWINPR